MLGMEAPPAKVFVSPQYQNGYLLYYVVLGVVLGHLYYTRSQIVLFVVANGTEFVSSSTGRKKKKLQYYNICYKPWVCLLYVAGCCWMLLDVAIL